MSGIPKFKSIETFKTRGDNVINFFKKLFKKKELEFFHQCNYCIYLKHSIECHRFPPAHGIKWSQVNGTDWCGEFKMRENNK